MSFKKKEGLAVLLELRRRFKSAIQTDVQTDSGDDFFSDCIQNDICGIVQT